MFIRLCLALSFLIFLSACDTAEERAEKHFQNAVALLDEGDPDRALIELRNTLQLNTSHLEARRLYADTVLAQGKQAEGLAQYLRLAEQAPDDVEANRTITRMSLELGDYDEAESYVENALEVLPNDPELKAMKALVDYQLATRSQDSSATNDALEVAQRILDLDQSQPFARQTVVTDLINRQDWPSLLAETEEALAHDPDALPMHRARLMALERLGQAREIEASLLEITQRFPEETELGTKLINWYLKEGRPRDAENWLRDQLATSADPDARRTLLYFIHQTRGAEAALADLDSALTADPRPADISEAPMEFEALRAALQFELGQKDKAIARMEELLEGAENSQATDRIRTALASMLQGIGRSSEAKTLVDATLDHDPSQVEALQMRADWLVQADQTGDAILLLRKALDQDPTNTRVLETLSRAYAREGNRDLVADTLMRAVEASHFATNLTLRLSDELRAQGQFSAAEELLIDALRRHPTDMLLLTTLAEIHIAMEDWGRVTQDIQRLRSLDTPGALEIADQLQGQQLIAREKTDELISFVETRLGGDNASLAMVVRSLVLAGQMDQALKYAEAAHQENPEDAETAFVYATALGHTGQDEQAINLFQTILTAEPRLRDGWMAIYNLYQRAGQPEEGLAILDQAADHLPGDPGLEWIRASHLQANGDVDAAIAIYEELYEQDSSQDMIANNLASLLSTVRQDQDSLNRAYILARRLKGSPVPAYQDTYGWIAYRRGEISDALVHLEPAAARLDQDASVHYHLAMAYLADGQTDPATDALATAERLANGAAIPSASLLEAIEQAKSELTAPETPNAPL